MGETLSPPPAELRIGEEGKDDKDDEEEIETNIEGEKQEENIVGRFEKLARSAVQEKKGWSDELQEEWKKVEAEIDGSSHQEAMSLIRLYKDSIWQAKTEYDQKVRNAQAALDYHIRIKAEEYKVRSSIFEHLYNLLLTEEKEKRTIEA